jgi:hypothetical protein
MLSVTLEDIGTPVFAKKGKHPAGSDYLIQSRIAPDNANKNLEKLTSRVPDTPLHSPTMKYGANSGTGSAPAQRARSSRALSWVETA